jgi:hypothetical protein
MSIPHSKFAAVCSFTFADGPSAQSSLCYFHEKKEAEMVFRRERGRSISTGVTGDYLSGHRLSGANMLQTIKVAEHEFINGFGLTRRHSFNGQPDPQAGAARHPSRFDHTIVSTWIRPATPRSTKNNHFPTSTL